MAAPEQEKSTAQHNEDKSSGGERYAGEQEDFNTRQRILRASLPFVNQYGWTKKAIIAGTEAEGLPSVSHGMFPRGGAELVNFFYITSNKELANILAERVKEAGDEKPKTREFIHDALETRLKMILPYVDTWPQAMAIQTLPQNAIESWTNLVNLMDDIWYYAGDRSVDFNWYTKRASLAAAYKATEIYMIQDRSEEKYETWAFLDRRIDDLQFFGKAIRSSSQMGTVVSEGLWGLCIMGRNVMGMNSRDRWIHEPENLKLHIYSTACYSLKKNQSLKRILLMDINHQHFK